MNAADALQAGAFVFVVALLVKPVGAYLERVSNGDTLFLMRCFYRRSD